MDKTVAELFAGVGGFRVGMNNVTLKNGQTHESATFKFVWSNQWEPGAKNQYAFDCYNKRFNGGSENTNIDIAKVDKTTIPDHTVLCGGFPCQDYSVARSLSQEKGIEGKKGVLWWEINSILKAKKPPFVFLENVDRLLKSPHKQIGRDFGIMLRCFYEQGYGVEWRVINAAEYGFTQRRRRTFIFAFRKNTKFFADELQKSPKDVFLKDGIFARAFKVKNKDNIISEIEIKKPKDMVEFSDSFKADFKNSGFMIDGVVYTTKTFPVAESPITLRQMVEENVDEHYYLDSYAREKFIYLRGRKKIERTSKDGHKYFYSEGSMSSVDSLDLPGRTMLTSEGSINRSTHIIVDPQTNRERILTPVECERLNMFPDGWTDTGMPEKMRYFIMGNALVCGIIKRVGRQISKIIDQEA
ncbi:MAG: DNA (cytosine-5-)-methyltransferase [Bacilli bacterium]|jgi:DNA (cytosine-5)-methyltransferase 1|nr:DNA (cytosine-5-)-methyltransferase [Bacilli bacterium]